MSVVTRFPPSPTGLLHIGGVRTALFNWLFARQHDGRFILRIEDTDKERTTSEAVDSILEGLNWLGIDFDEGPVFQTDRFERYTEVVQKLIDEDFAYRCYCSKERLANLREKQISLKQKPRYDGHCKDLSVKEIAESSFVVRLRTPESGTVLINDRVQGRVCYDNEELDDLIIARTDGSPTYHLSAVVDDVDMGVTHVIRGDDHLNNTPRQIHIYNALDETLPEYAHIPMIHGQDGKKLSKRHGALSILEYRDSGFLPGAMINYLSRLGWSSGDKEIFKTNELKDLFRIEGINKAAAKFDWEKLVWVNHQHLLGMELPAIAGLVRPFFQMEISSKENRLGRIIELQRERSKTLKELAETSGYFFEHPEAFDPKAAKKHFEGAAREVLMAVKMRLIALKDWDTSAIEEILKAIQEEFGLGMGKVAQPIRVAITGSAASPSIAETLFLIGRGDSLERINKALEYINGQEV